MTPKRTKKYLYKITKDAKLVRKELKGYKSHITKQFNSGVYLKLKSRCKVREKATQELH